MSSGQGLFFCFSTKDSGSVWSGQEMGRDLASCLLAYWHRQKPAGSSWIHLTLGSHDHSFLRSHSKNVYKCRRTGRLPVEQEVGVWSAVFGRDDQVGKNKWSGRTCSCSRCDPRPSSSPCFQREEVEIKKNQMEARCPFHWLIVFCSFPSPSAAWECLWKINRKWGCFSDIYSRGGGGSSQRSCSGRVRACMCLRACVCSFPLGPDLSKREENNFVFSHEILGKLPQIVLKAFFSSPGVRDTFLN